MTNEYDNNIGETLCFGVGTHCWIGLNDRLFQNNYMYIDGTNVANTYGFDTNGDPTVGILPWAPGEPNDETNHEHCIHYWEIRDWTWNDRSCTHKKAPICMRIQTNPLKQLTVSNILSDYISKYNIV